jgi:hypothetical protein
MNDDLGDAKTVSQVNEAQAAMVTFPVHPANERYLFAYVFSRKLTAGVATK